MKVLLLCYRGNPYCGGQGIYVYNLSRELARLGIEVDVMTGPPYPEPVDQWATLHKVENLNIWAVRTAHLSLHKLKRALSPMNFLDYILTRLHVFPEMETFSFRAFSLVKKLLKSKRYDIIHDVNSLGWGLVPMKGFGVPIISTIHHPLTRDRNSDLMRDGSFWEKITTLLFYPLGMQRFVINRLDHVITSFREGVDELHDAFGLDRPRISVVYNGMDMDVFRNHGECREENSLLFVGNTEDYKKGIQFLIEALSMMPEHINLTIVDEGPPLKMNAHNLVKKFRVENRVTFTGKVDIDTLVKLYNSKTVVVMSSLYEGFGLPAAEAMACGTPVVATTAGALKEVVDSGSGILVEPGNARALKEAVMTLLDDRGLRLKMGSESRKKIEKKFAWPAAAANTLEVYKQVIDEYGSGR